MTKKIPSLEKRIEDLEAQLALAQKQCEEFRAQATVFQEVIELGQDGIAVYDGNLRLVFCNQNFKNLFKEIGPVLTPGRPIADVSRSIAESGLIPEAAHDVDAWVEGRTNIAKRKFNSPYLIGLADGRWLRARDYRTRDGGILAIRSDITDMKERQEELEVTSEETRNVLEAFFQNSPVPMFIKGTDRRYQAVNSAFETLYGIRGEDVIGKRTEQALPDMAASLGRSTDFAILQGAGPVSREHQIFPVVGGEGTAATTKFPIHDTAGKIAGIGAVTVDITRFIDMQEKLAAKSDLLETTLRSIDQGFAVFDKDMRILACNQRFFELHNYNGELPEHGLDLRQMLMHYAKTGGFGTEDPRGAVERRIELLASPDRPGREERVQSNGMILDVRRTSLADGGYVATFTDITDLKHAERQAENARKLLRETLDSLLSSVALYDSDGRLRYCNEATRQLFGWQIELYEPGTTFEAQQRDALDKNMVSNIAGSKEDWLRERMAQFRRKAVDIVTERPGDRWIESHFRPTSDGGTVAVHRDITDQKRAEFALRRSEENFRSLVEHTEIGISISVRRKFLFVNDAFAEIFGYANRDEVMERGHYDAFIAPHDLERVRAISDARTADRPAPNVYEFEGIRKDGSIIRLQRTSRMVDWHGQRATLGTVIDVTQRHNAESRLRAALDAAETANRAKSDFLAKMSHELRTPLNAIIGFSEVLGRETFGPLGHARYNSYVDDIAVSGRHLLEMINDILDMSKIESGRYEIAPLEANIVPIINETLQVVRGQMEQRALTLDIDVPAGMPPIFADPRAIRQILLNLLSNAIKFTPKGGSISVIANQNAEGGTRLSVSDTGIGIDREDLEAVLQPFNQGNNTSNIVQPGTGLGLPIVKSLTELHGGTMTIKSERGAGTTVSIELPHRAGAAADKAQSG